MSDRSPFIELNNDGAILNLTTVWSISKFYVSNLPRPYGIYFEYGVDVVYREYFSTEAERDVRYEEIKEIVMSKNIQPKNDCPIGVTTTAKIQ